MVWTCPGCALTIDSPRGIGGHVRKCSVTAEQLFWAKVDKSGGPAACWPWTGPKIWKGYGRWTSNRIAHRTHRHAYRLTFGEPGGMQVLHTCDNPPCCNPKHLFLGTHDDNMADKSAKGRVAWGEQCPRRKLTEEQAIEILSMKGKGPARMFAGKYGVRDGAIHAIWRGTAWPRLSRK